MIFRGSESKRAQKLTLREVNAQVPAMPQWLDWSETPVSFDRSDLPNYIPHPCKSALVVDPLVVWYQLTKLLMDGGSGIYIMYADKLKRMQIPPS